MTIVVWTAPEINLVNNYRVYFNPDTGQIIRTSNSVNIEDDYPSIEVKFEDIEQLLEGTADVMVVYDSVSKTYVLNNHVGINVSEKSNIVECLYNPDADIIIEQDLVNTCWKFTISDSLLQSMKTQKVSVNFNLQFRLTKKSNPHIFYRTIDIPFKKLYTDFYVVEDFVDKFEFDGLPISVYTVIDTIQRNHIYSYEVNK